MIVQEDEEINLKDYVGHYRDQPPPSFGIAPLVFSNPSDSPPASPDSKQQWFRVRQQLSLLKEQVQKARRQDDAFSIAFK